MGSIKFCHSPLVGIIKTTEFSEKKFLKSPPALALRAGVWLAHQIIHSRILTENEIHMR